MKVETFQMEAPFTLEDGSRQLYVSGNVRLGGRWPQVSNFRAVDQRTDEDLELPDWVREEAEELLVKEAEVLWEPRS